MDTIIVSEGFGIIPISMILGTMINAEDSGESPRGNKLTTVLRHICHVSSLGLSRMTSAEWLSNEHVSLLLLVVFLGYWSNYEPPRVFSLITCPPLLKPSSLNGSSSVKILEGFQTSPRVVIPLVRGGEESLLLVFVHTAWLSNFLMSMHVP